MPGERNEGNSPGSLNPRRVRDQDLHDCFGLLAPRRVIFVSGDDADAKAQVVALFDEAAFAPIDLGDLATGGAMQQIHHRSPVST